MLADVKGNKLTDTLGDVNVKALAGAPGYTPEEKEAKIIEHWLKLPPRHYLMLWLTC